MMRLIEHKNEVIAAVIGALVAGLLSAAFGLYSMNKSFQMSQSKELLLGLRLDISTLRNVDRELDDNIKLLLSNNYQIKAEFEEVEFTKIPVIGKKKQDQEFAKWLKDYQQRMIGKQYKVKSFVQPPDRFVVGSWLMNSPSASDIDFELVQSLNELNRSLLRVNSFLEHISTIGPGTVIDESTKIQLDDSIPRYNSMIAEVTQKKLIQIKNQITDEIKKLQKRRDEISL
jgi:hypothetical protein